MQTPFGAKTFTIQKLINKVAFLTFESDILNSGLSSGNRLKLRLIFEFEALRLANLLGFYWNSQHIGVADSAFFHFSIYFWV